jgi:pimeloyl-ACP methyl ester carboxylesterase
MSPTTPGAAVAPAPRIEEVQCLSPAGLHTMRYAEWGDPRCERVVLCVHGLTRTGRDFDHLARRLAGEFRVVCPDIVGRGISDWLRDPRHYGLPQYCSDIVTLIARLDAKELSWVGTSMGGLIGIGVAGLQQSPVRRFVINDVGPRVDPAAVARIGSYVGQPVRFATLEDAIAYNRQVAAGFGMRNDDEWREITASVLKRDGDAFVFRYDPGIAAPFKTVTQEAAAIGEKVLWGLYDAIGCPTLLIRGELTDLLTIETAREMQQRGPKPSLATIPGVGHAPMFFDPAQIDLVADFLRA